MVKNSSRLMLQNKDKKDEEEKCDGTLRETTKF
jgi:hypothetical protein